MPARHTWVAAVVLALTSLVALCTVATGANAREAKDGVNSISYWSDDPWPSGRTATDRRSSS